MKAILKASLLVAGVLAVVAGGTVIWMGSRGISARAEPGRLETVVARAMRRLAIPRAARALKNPLATSADAITQGMAHYADHCASCHANDGSGHTELGQGLYPKPPDMRLPPTQSLTDGELFYIIENGVRLTGMPAWSTGTEQGNEGTWQLVRFIRELPRLTPEQLDRMKALNPRSRDEVLQEIEEEKFLAGETDQPALPASPPHQH